MRPNKGSDMLPSDVEIDPPRLKPGRAEEVIARMRSSASPIHSSIIKDVGMGNGSSPSRGEYVRMLPPPLTPAIKFKKPARPPPSVSPNTSLRNHRMKIQQMVNSPIRRLGLTDEDPPWSPAFNIQEEFIRNENAHGGGDDVFESGSALEDFPTPARISPEKPRQRRLFNSGRLGENVLAEVSSMNVNSRMNLSSSLSGRARGLGIPDSPSRQPLNAGGRFTSTEPDDFFSFHLFDDSHGEVDGVDLLQGFQKIGGGSKELSPNPKGHVSRPTLGHRWNSLF